MLKADGFRSQMYAKKFDKSLPMEYSGYCKQTNYTSYQSKAPTILRMFAKGPCPKTCPFNRITHTNIGHLCHFPLFIKALMQIFFVNTMCIHIHESIRFYLSEVTLMYVHISLTCFCVPLKKSNISNNHEQTLMHIRNEPTKDEMLQELTK